MSVKDKTDETIEIGGTLLLEFWRKDMMSKAFQMLIEKARKDFIIRQEMVKTLLGKDRARRLIKILAFDFLSINQEETVLVKVLN